MPLKVALVQQPAPGAPGTLDFADASAGFANDLKAAIFISATNTTLDTETGKLMFTVGLAAATGGTTQMVVACKSDDSVAGATVARATYYRNAAYAWAEAGATGSTATGSATLNAWLSNGAQLNFDDAPVTPAIITALLLGGDIEAKVVSATGTSVLDETVNVAHGLGGAPEVIIGLTVRHADAAPRIGFWTGNGVGHGSFFDRDAVDPTQVRLNVGATNFLVCEYNATAPIWNVANVGAMTFDLVNSQAADNRVIYLLCLRGTSVPITAKAGVFTGPTVTGNSAVISGMTAAPQALLLIPTQFQTTLETAETGGFSTSFGLIASCNRNGSTTQSGGVSIAADDGISTTDTATQTTNADALRVLTNTGVMVTRATVSSWGSGGVTLNYATNSGSAYKIPYLAFGIAAGQSIAVRAAAYYAMFR